MITAISMMLLGYLAESTGRDPRLLLITFVSIGIDGVFFSGPNNIEIMRALPRAKINIASSFSATIRNMGMALGVPFSSVLVSLQLVQAGYYGTLVEAGPALLSAIISRVKILAGILCIIGTLVSIYRGLNSAQF